MKFYLLFNQITQGGTSVVDSLVNHAEDRAVVTQTVFEMIMDSGLSTLITMIPLALLLVSAIYISLFRFMAIRRAAAPDGHFHEKLRDYMMDGKVEAASKLCASTDSPSARLLEKGIRHIGKPMNDIRTAIENSGKLEIFNLERGLSTLATIAGAAPMIGFLGTVIGMIITFHAIAVSPNVEIGALSGGIMQAMVTTVAGLIIGILAYVCYNMLVTKVGKVIHQMEASEIEFMDLLQEPGK